MLAAIGCSSDNGPPPTITSIVPDPLCSDGMTFMIKGTNFDPKAVVTIDGNAVQGTSVTDAKDIVVTVASGTVTGGDHTVTVTNPDKQKDTGTLTGEPKPLMFFVDPNVLSADITARMNVYMSGLTTTIQSVSVQSHSDATPNPNAAVALADVAAVADHPNQVQATVTAGLNAGKYDVSATDGVCTATLQNGLTIVGAPDITITGVNPPFGAPDQDTAITVTASGSPVTQTPRVFLSSGGKATALSAVSFQSATSVSAVVPRNALPAGDYDVIVIDPLDPDGGGHVGVLAKGFHLIAAPPVVDSVTPQTVTASIATEIAIQGSNFSIDARAWLSKCTAPSGITPPVTPFALPAPTSATPTQLKLTVAGSTMAAGVVCTLRVINGTPADPATPSDPCPAGGTCLPFADFSAIASTNGSGNLGTWVQSTAQPTDTVKELPDARTRLGVVAGHVNAQTRFLYALGGDGGAVTGARGDVVSTQLDPLGDMLGWTPQRNAMLAPRTGQATIRIGQFLYAIGGSSDGTTALATVERARILDPLDVPAVPGIDLTPSATGLDAGTWVYRVSGVRAADFASDPGGETLPSDPLNVTLPDLTSMAATPKVKVTLTWPAMPNVASYNLYRTSAPGHDATEVQLIASVPQAAGMVTFEDTGLATTAQTPLPIGSLGKWNAASDLTIPRYGAAAAIAHGLKTATTDTWFLYVAGGAGDTALTQAGLLDTYEWARVDITIADGSQAVSPFTLGVAPTIGGGRAFLSAYSADSTIKADIAADTTFVYFGSGIDQPMGTLGLKSAMVVGSLTPASPDGDLGALATTSAAQVGGAGAATIAGFLFTIGGLNAGSTIGNTFSTTFCPGGTGCGTAGLPALTTWNNGGGGTPNLLRVLHSVVVEAPFIYIFGGSTSSGATNATPSTERTVW